jgi:hypothetical protein
VTKTKEKLHNTEPPSISDGEVGQGLRRSWQIRQIVYRDALESLDSIFTSLNIKYMPIKGAYLICSGMAERIKERQMIDLDILVEKDRFKEIIGILEKHPLFKKGKEDPWYFEQPFFFKNGNHSIRIEFHYLLNRPERFHLPNEELFSRSTKQTAVRYLPSSEDALLIAICHSMIHIAEGLNDSFFQEIKVHLEKKEFEWSKFEKLLYSAGIGPYGKFVFNLYRKKLKRTCPSLEKRYWWVDLFNKNTLLSDKTFGIKQISRRLLFELPFAAKPYSLAANWFKQIFMLSSYLVVRDMFLDRKKEDT